MRRRRRLRRYRRSGSGTAGSLWMIICFAALLRLMSSLGICSALDSTLIRLGSSGRFVYGALAAQTGSISGSFKAPETAIDTETVSTEVEIPVLPPEETEQVYVDIEVTPSPVPEADIILMETAPEPSAEPEQAAEAFVFTRSDADSIEYTNATKYDPDELALMDEPFEIDFTVSGPLVLIVHTHTCEAYTPAGDDLYEASDSWRTTDQAMNIVAVGNELEQVLTEAGIGVVHDTTVNDYPSYTGSYTRTLEVIERNLEQYPSIQIVIDLHRDSGVSESGEAVATYYTGNGDKTAQVMLVVGTDEGGLPHENWRENLKLALAVQARANASHPGLMRPVNLRQERFNQHATYGSLIVETGFAGNTLDEAKAAIRLFGSDFAALLQALAESQ